MMSTSTIEVCNRFCVVIILNLLGTRMCSMQYIMQARFYILFGEASLAHCILINTATSTVPGNLLTGNRYTHSCNMRTHHCVM